MLFLILSWHIKSYEPEKICLIFKKRGKHPLKVTQSIRFSVPENPTVQVSSSYLYKCGILYFLPDERSRMRVYLLFFFPG